MLQRDKAYKQNTTELVAEVMLDQRQRKQNGTSALLLPSRSVSSLQSTFLSLFGKLMGTRLIQQWMDRRNLDPETPGPGTNRFTASGFLPVFRTDSIFFFFTFRFLVPFPLSENCNKCFVFHAFLKINFKRLPDESAIFLPRRKTRDEIAFLPLL